jgi:membrane-associated phospholipid phosphatase
LNTKNVFPKLISCFFHPLLLPTFGLFLVFHISELGLWSPAFNTRLALYSLTFSLTFVLPLLSILFLYKIKYIPSLELHTREERKLPYLTAAFFYFCQSYLMMHLEVPALIKASMLGATVLIVSTTIVNLFWKISAHMVGIGGLCGMIIAISSRLQVNLHYLLMGLFILSGLIAFSRLKLNEHTPGQVYGGFLLGILILQLLFL